MSDWLTRQRSLLRIGFWVYALLLFTATHWPALELNVRYVERPDLLIHFACFGSWFAWYWAAAWSGPPLRARSILLSAAVSIAYAGLDEGLQGIPIVRRHCAWDDFFANCGGIGLAALLAGGVAYVCRPPQES